MYSCLKKVASTILLVIVQLNWSNIKDTFHSIAASCYWPQDVGIYNAEPQSNKNNARKRSEVQLKKWLLREILNPRREVGMINKVRTINTHFPWHHLTQVIWFAFVDHDPSLFPRWIPTWNLKSQPEMSSPQIILNPLSFSSSLFILFKSGIFKKSLCNLTSSHKLLLAAVQVVFEQVIHPLIHKA